MQVFDVQGDAGTPENITPTSSTGITAAIRHPTSGKYKGMTAKSALITCEAGDVHMTLDGTAPTALAGTNVGHVLYVGDSYVIRGQENVKNALFIDRVAATPGIIKVTPFF